MLQEDGKLFEVLVVFRGIAAAQNYLGRLVKCFVRCLSGKVQPVCKSSVACDVLRCP